MYCGCYVCTLPHSSQATAIMCLFLCAYGEKRPSTPLTSLYPYAILSVGFPTILSCPHGTFLCACRTERAFLFPERASVRAHPERVCLFPERGSVRVLSERASVRAHPERAAVQKNCLCLENFSVQRDCLCPERACLLPERAQCRGRVSGRIEEARSNGSDKDL